MRAPRKIKSPAIVLLAIGLLLTAGSFAFWPGWRGLVARDSGKKIRLGVVTLLRHYGKPEQPAHSYAVDAALLYFQKINRSGGVHGAQIELLIRHSLYTREDSDETARKLLEDEPDVLAFLWSHCNEQTLGVLDVSKETGVPLLFPISASEIDHPLLFHVRPSYSDELVPLFRFPIPIQLRVPVTIVTERDETCFRGRAAFSKFSKRKVAADFYLGPASRTDSSIPDLEETVEAVAKANPPLVFLNTLRAAGPFLERSIKKNFHPMYITLSTVNLSTLDLPLQAALDNLYSAEFFPLVSHSKHVPAVREFQELMASSGIERTNQDMFQGYMGARVLVEALKAAGPVPTRAGLVKAMESLARLEIGGLEFSYSASKHRGAHKIYLYKYVKGVPMALTPKAL